MLLLQLLSRCLLPDAHSPHWRGPLEQPPGTPILPPVDIPAHSPSFQKITTGGRKNKEGEGKYEGENRTKQKEQGKKEKEGAKNKKKKKTVEDAIRLLFLFFSCSCNLFL